MGWRQMGGDGGGGMAPVCHKSHNEGQTSEELTSEESSETGGTETTTREIQLQRSTGPGFHSHCYSTYHTILQHLQ